MSTPVNQKRHDDVIKWKHFPQNPSAFIYSCQYSSNHFILMLPGTLWNAIFIACFQVNICDPERGESFLRVHQCFIVLKCTFYHSWKPGKHTYFKFFLVKTENPSSLLSQCLPIAPILTKLSILQWRHNECDSVSNHLTIAYSTVYSGADQRKHQSSVALPLYGEFTGDRRIPHTNGQ